jgi:hypothetical protein
LFSTRGCHAVWAKERKLAPPAIVERFPNGAGNGRGHRNLAVSVNHFDRRFGDRG